MKNTLTSKGYNRAKTQTVLLAMFFLYCLLFCSCSRNKPGTDNALTGAANKEEQTNITGMLYPCHWSYEVEQSNPGEATLIATAKIDSGWHLYSQHVPDAGPPPTEFAFPDLPDYQLIGNTEEEKAHKEYDPFFEMEILYFKEEAVFRQKIKVLSKQDFTITGTIDYMVCLTQCVPSSEEFSFNVKGNPIGE